MKPHQPTVLKLVRAAKPGLVLDCPSGGGWLGRELSGEFELDGLDLAPDRSGCYQNFFQRDLNEGLPEQARNYDCIVSCEGAEHLYAPAVFFKAVRKHLNPGGLFIISTPNIWYPSSKVQFFLRGFFPSFPSLAGKIKTGTHMHITPWSFPQLHLILTLCGFTEIQIHQTDWPAPKYFHERILGLPQFLYCRSRERRAESAELKKFWQMAGSPASLFARGLVVSARV